MLCDSCGKNQATVHLTEIIDEQMNELHLCEECARQKSSQMEQQFGLNDLLAGMTDFITKPDKEKAETTNLSCPKCGLTFADFRKIGRLGCGACYTAFKKQLVPLLRKIHGSAQHMGKSVYQEAKPSRKKTDVSELEGLRIKLQKAIENEAFEEAARIRDMVKELEKQQTSEKDKERGA